MTSYREAASIPSSRHGAIFIACLIAQSYKAPPSAKQLIRRFGMSRATAYRWAMCFRDVAEMEHAGGFHD
jgi:hypothetical protein